MVDVWRDDWSDVQAWFAPMGVADGVAIHHTASAAHPASYDPALLRQIEHGEIAAGYNALAYHTMVFDDGFLAESRPYGAMGAATGGHNDHTIAFCYIGYFHPPYYHVASEAALLKVAREIKGLVDFGFLRPDYYVVWPHQTWTAGTPWATACCGSELIPRVPDIDAWSRVEPAPPAPPIGVTMDAITAIDPGLGTALMFFRSGDLIVKEISGPPVAWLNNIPDHPDTGPWLNGGSGVGGGAIPYRNVSWQAMLDARTVHNNALITPGGGGDVPVAYVTKGDLMASEARVREDVNKERKIT